MSKSNQNSEICKNQQQPTGRPVPRWYISRSDGALVPLVPVDELPDGYDIADFPRRLHFTKIHNMEWLGEVTAPETKVLLEPFTNHSSKGSQTDFSLHSPFASLFTVTEARAEQMSQETSSGTLEPPSKPADKAQGAQITNTRQPIKSPPWKASSMGASQGPRRYKPVGVTTASPMNLGPSLPPSGAEPDQAKKIYCSFWIRTGECDYVQPGCFYKHEMPDLATLNRVGFRQVPRWYREKQAAEREVARTAAFEARASASMIKSTAPKATSMQTWKKSNSLGAIGSERELARGPASNGVSLAKTSQDISALHQTTANRLSGLMGSRYAPLGALDTKEVISQTVEKPLDEEEPLIDFVPLQPDRSARIQFTTSSEESTPPSVPAVSHPPADPSLNASNMASTAAKPTEESAPLASPITRSLHTDAQVEPVQRFATQPKMPSPRTLALEETNLRMQRDLMAAKAASMQRVEPKEAQLPASSTEASSDIQLEPISQPNVTPSGKRGSKRRRGRKGHKNRHDANAAEKSTEA